ncbi:hypothetical protein FRC08_011252 [Ceratobasidium sp. 394]|nr:hypothetical protein FRC08_011252 [Ceratobasidium sp. 394]
MLFNCHRCIFARLCPSVNVAHGLRWQRSARHACPRIAFDSPFYLTRLGTVTDVSYDVQSYGLAERLFKEGNQIHQTAFYNPAPDGSGIECSDRLPGVIAPTARYLFGVTLHQGAIEDIFRDAMRALGSERQPNDARPREFEHRAKADAQFSWPPRSIEVEQPIVPTSISISTDPAELASRDSYPVTVHLKRLSAAEATRLSHPVAGAPPNSNEAAAGTSTVEVEGEQEEIVKAKFVVGCDGAHSWTRAQMGWEMEGEHTDYVWGAVDTIPDTDFPDIRNRVAIHSDNGVAQRSFKPFRLEFPDPLEWWTIYIIGQRVASKFSAQERVFIAGDACHTHSPKAGQGMNASMNDTHNLVWKLTQVLRGWASPELLKTVCHLHCLGHGTNITLSTSRNDESSHKT